jgi:putative ABC transport system ATP-binding protein
MGVVFQSFHLIPTMTALENVALPLELAGTADAFPRAEAELADVGLAHRRMTITPANCRAANSSAWRWRAPLPRIRRSCWPTSRPATSTARTAQAIMDLLFALRDRHGATLVLVTHAPELAARCDRVIRLADGPTGRLA